LAALLALGLAPYILDAYAVNILVRSFLYAAAALTVDLLWGYTGILTFGQSAFFGIGAYAAGLIFAHAGFSPGTATLAFVAGIVVSVLLAGLVGWLSFWDGASPFYVTIITLVVTIAVTQIIFSGGTFTGSSSGLTSFETFDLSVEAWFWISGSGLILLTAGAWIFVNSDAGRVLVAIRENEQRCEYLGIQTSLVKTTLLMTCAAIAAIAGYAYAGYTVVVTPELTNFSFGTELVIWVALAGRGTLIAPVLGTIIIDLTSAYLSGSLPFVWRLLIGLGFVVVIVALPEGLLPAIGRAVHRIFSRSAVTEPKTKMERVVERDSPRTTGPHGRPALEIRDVHRSFGSLQVLSGITISAHHDELISVVGPNGAGKSTLLHCVSDGNARSSGEVIINGTNIGRRPPYGCVSFGVGRKFQTANIFDTLTVSECLRVAGTRHRWPSFWRRDNCLLLPRSALQVLETTGLSRNLHVQAQNLSHGLKQALELVMVLALEPSVLLLDEPTAGLTRHERGVIGSILTDLVRAHGLCVVLIEHDLEFVREISSRIVVLHQGRIALDGTVAEVADSQLVREIYAGHTDAEQHE
jgi:branched-chain amino acid transport system permease protein